jgi:outer membrane protein
MGKRNRPNYGAVLKTTKDNLFMTHYPFTRLTSSLLLSLVMTHTPVMADKIEDALIATSKNNPDLQEVRQNVRSGHEKIVQATASWRPTVDASASISGSQVANSGNQKSSGGSTPGGSATNTRQGALTVKQNLFNGGSTVSAVSGVENSIKSSWASLDVAEQNIFLQAAEAFLNLLSNYSEVTLLKANELALKKTLEATQDKFNIGEETRTSVAQAEGKYAEAVAKRQTSEATLEGYKATYTRITGLKPGNLEKPIGHDGLPDKVEKAIENAQNQNPSIIAAQFDYLAAKDDIGKVGGQLLPKLDLTAQSARTEARSSTHYIFNDRDYRSNDFNTNNSVTLNLTVPLYEGGSVRSQKREAHEVSTAKRIAVEKVRRQVIEQAIQFWQNFIAAKANIASFKKQVQASEVSLEGTKQEMEVGSKILLDVLNAQSDLLNAQLQLVRAEKDYFLGGYRLMAAMGQLNSKYLKLNLEHFNPQAHFQQVRRQI